MTPRALTSSSRVLAAIPLAALAVVGSLTVGGQGGLAPTPTSAPQRPRPTAPAPAPQPLAPVAVAPATQDPATAWNGTVRPALNVTATSSDIPAVALAAYQRAATTIDAAAPACRLDWSFLAAIGKVESNHGRGHLDAQGDARPAIVGPALTGTNGTALVPDTDGGLYDGDTRYDHAVGPMQILPATWAAVGVDANGDGKRDPQNIDDAALAAAVFLCSDGGDLSTPAGQQAAALRYNPAPWYADTVVAIAHGYATSAPVSSVLPAFYISARTAVPGVVPLTPVKHRHHHKTGPSTIPTGTAAGGSAHGSHVATSAPATPPVPTPPAPSTPSGPSTPLAPPSPDPTKATTPTDPSAPTAPTAPTAPAPSSTPTPAPATADELQTMCSTAIKTAYPDATTDALTQATQTCVQKLTGKTAGDAQAALPALVAGLPQSFPALVPAPAPSPSPTSAPSGTSSPSASAPPATDPSVTPAS